MDLHSIISEGLKQIKKTEYVTQHKFLSQIAELRGLSVADLQKCDCVFIPNDNYLAAFCGDVIRDFQYDCYITDNICKWSNCLIFPIRNVANHIVALGGFNPFLYLESKESGNKSSNYYTYSSKNTFRKGNFLYYPDDDFNKALKNGYIFIVDGIFDAISLNALGFNVAALMDSTVTNERVVQLRFIKKVFLLHDNDNAGITLSQKLKERLPNLVIVNQNQTKDIDELLKTEYRQKAIRTLERIISNSEFDYRIVHL